MILILKNPGDRFHRRDCGHLDVRGREGVRDCGYAHLSGCCREDARVQD